MSKSLPVIVRLEWVPASTISARNLLNLASAPATPELHAPSIDQVGFIIHGSFPTESLCLASYYFLNRSTSLLSRSDAEWSWTPIIGHDAESTINY